MQGENQQAHTPGPWEYIPSSKHHGPYVASAYGGDICDCYTMSNPSSLSVRNGGDSKPIHFQHERADANARLIASAPELLAELDVRVGDLVMLRRAIEEGDPKRELLFRIDDMLRESRAAIAKAEGRADA